MILTRSKTEVVCIEIDDPVDVPGTCRLSSSAIILLLMGIAEMVGDRETYELLLKKYGDPEKLAKSAFVVCVDP
jgi:hypothetical protein